MKQEAAAIKPNIEREKELVERMIRLYCKHAEGNAELCPACAELLSYAHRRLDHCRYGNDKGSCGNCQTHCYASQQRDRIRRVMRYVGPRLIYLSPAAFWRHFWQSSREKWQLRKRRHAK